VRLVLVEGPSALLRCRVGGDADLGGHKGRLMKCPGAYCDGLYLPCVEREDDSHEGQAAVVRSELEEMASQRYTYIGIQGIVDGLSIFITNESKGFGTASLR
jgi:hypothetical protein